MPRGGKEDAGRREPVSADEAMAGADTAGATGADGNVRRPAADPAMEPGRSEADTVEGGLPDRDGQAHSDLPRGGEDQPEAVGPYPPDTGQAGGGPGRAGGGLSDLLEARVRAVQARLLSGETLTPAAPDQTSHTPLGALAARARSVRAQLAEAYERRLHARWSAD